MIGKILQFTEIENEIEIGLTEIVSVTEIGTTTSMTIECPLLPTREVSQSDHQGGKNLK
jgi:hypothetical protein